MRRRPQSHSLDSDPLSWLERSIRSNPPSEGQQCRVVLLCQCLCQCDVPSHVLILRSALSPQWQMKQLIACSLCYVLACATFARLGSARHVLDAKPCVIGAAGLQREIQESPANANVTVCLDNSNRCVMCTVLLT